MKPSKLFSSLAILLMLVMTACGNKNENADSKTSSKPQIQKTKKLTDAEKRLKELEIKNHADLDKYINQECDESTTINLSDLDFSLLKDYLYSSKRTNKKDSKSFCLHEIYNNAKAVTRLVYERTDGGPYGDIISIWSLNKTTNQLWQYHLFSEFEKGGYHQKSLRL